MTPVILYEDNHLLAAIKPHRMPSQQDSSNDEDMLSALKAYIKEKYHKPGEVYLGLVHRLDRPAGGVMVFARTSKAAARLAEQLQNGTMKKTYLAVVTGNPPLSGEFQDYLAKDSEKNIVRVSEEGEGKLARLDFAILERQGSLSLARIHLHTGRSHQIRVQFASRGYALYGDAKYGKGEGDTLALFSHSIEIVHPTKKVPLVFSAMPVGNPFMLFHYIADCNRHDAPS